MLGTEPKGAILLVDDDVNFVTLMSGYLSYQGYDVTTAETGTEAIELLGDVKPDLIISDIVMPEMNGYKFAETVRKSPEINWIPIIFLSARDQSQDRVRGLSSGATVYMIKPFELAELSAQIESALRSSQLMQQNRSKRAESKISVPEGVKLTNTELTVARLVAQGLSNLEIATRLNASKRTIESHISHMLKKTLLNNRTELSRWIIENNME
ncbi:response regulator transcription factor [Leptolyngbya sp. NIES-2104]|uniref:response regulator transcription factor n=1 Tax=Leptolyngbya sp. NIES-2104 TaxID=1552121 RepID=UPI0006EC45BD|nr:response regulator transcription factor [Leptolyngbya sp. NIES-2104]GAP97618.1 two-component response regulator [Leptolyngbya sp. NIES-2104]